MVISDSVISGNPTIQSLSVAAPKPSFLLLDKVYQKLSDEEELTWLLRAVQTTIPFISEELSKNAPLRYVAQPSEPQGQHFEFLFEVFKRGHCSSTWELNLSLISSGMNFTLSFDRLRRLNQGWSTN